MGNTLSQSAPASLPARSRSSARGPCLSQLSAIDHWSTPVRRTGAGQAPADIRSIKCARERRRGRRCGWLSMMGRDVAMDERLRVAVVCAPEILRLGLERVLAHDPALTVRAHRRQEAVRAPVDVVVLCERGLDDVATACAAIAAALDAGVVVVAAGANPHVVLDCLAAGATG